ncbi:MAG: HAD family hydrolase [Anaerolineales bacterium]
MSLAHIDAGHYDAVLFDLDGTLVETDNRWAKQLEDRLSWLKRLCPRADLEELSHSVVMAIETPGNYGIAMLERLGLAEALNGVSDRIRQSKGLATKDGQEIVQGSVALLEALQPRFRLAVVTTRARREASAFIQGLGLTRFFPVVITRQDVLRMKPHPEPLLKAAALLGVSPTRCIMVGDTGTDMRSARRAGALAVGVLSGFGTKRELERGGAQIILPYAADLAPLLCEPNSVDAASYSLASSSSSSPTPTR